MSQVVIKTLALTALYLARANAATSSPCAAVASAQVDYVEAYPDALFTLVPANLTYQCVSSIPVQQKFSTQLVQSLKIWYQLESQLDYTVNPATGYLWDPFNATKELDRIYDDVTKNRYSSQFDIEVDLTTLALNFHDFHTYFRGGIMDMVSWQRGFHLVSASSDGLELPKVYVARDLIDIDTQLDFHRSKKPSSSISAVASINGFPVQQFLQTQQLVAPSHDPDAMFNQLFLSVAQTINPGGGSLGVFRSPVFYPGAETIVKFENGTTVAPVNQAQVDCDLTTVKTGQDFWDSCISAPATTTTTSIPTATNTFSPEITTEAPEASTTAAPLVTQIPSHPTPVAIDVAGLLSGYYLEGESYDDIAVLVIRSFHGSDATYMESFQNTLEIFLSNATADGKTKLVIDVGGNGGGFIDLGTELVAQLFPNVPPDQKGNWRTSLGLELILQREGEILDAENKAAGSDENQILINEDLSPFSWQSLMSPATTEFVSFKDFYGPHKLGNHGSFTSFFQTNYTNTDPSELDSSSIQISGYDERPFPPETPPPFNVKNIVILSDGYCGSTCSNVFEILTNIHAIPAITIGGRPLTEGPMQTVGNSKGSQAFGDSVLGYFISSYLDDTKYPVDRSKAKGTIFETWDSFALDNGLVGLNGKNNYRIGDVSETVLQMVYTASDCKIWYTADMIADPQLVWSRAADIAFDSSRKELGAGGGPYTNKYCVKDSTGHATSVTGGLKKGELGSQDPPSSAKPQYLGWLRNGNEIVKGFSIVSSGTVTGSSSIPSTSPKTGTLSADQLKVGLADLHSSCSAYTGINWLFSLICGAVG